jgi:TonB family protein
MTGVVMLLVTVTPEGNAMNPLVLRRLGGGLDEAVLETIQQWRFTPAKDANGKPGAMRFEVEVIFRIEG